MHLHTWRNPIEISLGNNQQSFLNDFLNFGGQNPYLMVKSANLAGKKSESGEKIRMSAGFFTRSMKIPSYSHHKASPKKTHRNI